MGEGAVRQNWREIPVVELTDSEVALMSNEEQRWCGDLLFERHLLKKADPTMADAVAPEEIKPDPPVINDLVPGQVAVMRTGTRIFIYHNESDRAECFTGKIINPTEMEMRGHGHVSTLWDRAEVVRVEPDRQHFAAGATPDE